MPIEVVDKRKLHLSNIIITNQISRTEAMDIIKQEPYNENDIKNDINYFLKKLNWDNEKLNQYLNEKEIPHHLYGSEKKLWIFFTKLFKLFNS